MIHEEREEVKILGEKKKEGETIPKNESEANTVMSSNQQMFFAGKTARKNFSPSKAPDTYAGQGDRRAGIHKQRKTEHQPENPRMKFKDIKEKKNTRGTDSIY